MYISFEVDKTQAEKIALPTQQRFALVQGLFLLEKAHQELVASNTRGIVTYFLYAEKDQDLPVLEAELFLPIQQASMLEALTEPVTKDETLNPEEVKDFLQLVNQSLPKKQRTKKATLKKTEKRPIRDGQPFQKRRGFFLLIGSVGCVCLLTGGFFLGQSIQPSTKEKGEGVKTELTALTEQFTQQNKVETLGRFFLSNYYSGETGTKKRQGMLKKYVTPELLPDLLKQDQQIKSMFPWEITKKNKQWTMSFIAVLVQPDKEQATKKITFTAEENNSRLLVLERPKEETVEINQK